MSFATIATSARDSSLQDRITACAAQEGAADPPGAMSQLIWPVITSADIEAAYAFALAGGNPDPGGDETVITDQMILSAVQAHMATVVP